MGYLCKYYILIWINYETFYLNYIMMHVYFFDILPKLSGAID